MSGRYSSAEISGIGVTSQRIRDRMVDALRQEGISDESVLALMAQAPRHLFVEQAFSDHAYRSESVPIGYGQTLSQPWIVARMTELVCDEAPKRVLEIGTGSGFQTWLLAKRFDTVFSVERIEAMSIRARKRLHRLGVTNVRLRHADGRAGWPSQAPFDVILATACARGIHSEWVEQLAPGGVVIAPLLNSPDGDPAHGQQWLVRVRKTDDGIEAEQLEPVRFVPLLDGVVE
ncbi:protein-L-isoaspartate(D-aspartate) O-methyltransferase [Carnimonas bestiolae]|uniref:protein-L-isoaspartate(D-aspartate) O-methyltransferase n=1 Tax=Carnimonas bestiolae TaxID=3402172 RepID=UPI003EDB8CB3